MSYTHLSVEERYTLQRLDARGVSHREMARVLGRHHSSISREFKRNRLRTEYVYSEAQELAVERLRRAHRRVGLKAQQLSKQLEVQLKRGWSPEQIAGRLKQQRAALRISHEAIYQWLYRQRLDLCVYLCRRRRFRHPRGYTRRSLQPAIPLRVCISERPAGVAARVLRGHWEVDTMSLPLAGPAALLVSVERVTRYVHLARLPNRSPSRVRRSLQRFFLRIPKRLRRSITYDNGFENREHHKLNAALGMASYFCRPYHSWEKGTVENTIGLIRRFLPKGKTLDTISPSHIKAIENRLNNRPRKCLNYKTPKELFEAVALNA